MNKAIPKIKFSVADWICILICSIPAYYLLGHPAIYIWDEAVYVNASWDMAHGASWLVPVNPTYNTKPPLVLWLQALSLKVIPSAEWAVRLPSALAVSGILLMLQFALKRWGFDIWTRCLVLICFVSNEGFIRHHIGRTGDLDAVMSFFMTAYAITLLDAIVQRRWTNRHMVVFFIAVVGAFYAKSIGGWLLLGPLLFVWLLSPLRIVLIRPRFWIAGATALMACIAYYLVREMMQPGYLDLVIHSEYMRMFSNVMPWHEHGPGYYFSNFKLLGTYYPWSIVLALCTITGLFLVKDPKVKEHLLRWIILGAGFMLMITIPAVKLEWYDAPAYSWFALIIGGAMGHFVSRAPESMRWLLLIPATLMLWRKMDFLQKDQSPRHPFEYEGAMLREVKETLPNKVYMEVEHPEHRLQLDFYRKWIAEQMGKNVEVVDTISNVVEGDQLLISQKAALETIQSLFALDTIRVWAGLGYEVKVKEKK